MQNAGGSRDVEYGVTGDVWSGAMPGGRGLTLVAAGGLGGGVEGRVQVVLKKHIKWIYIFIYYYY